MGNEFTGIITDMALLDVGQIVFAMDVVFTDLFQLKILAEVTDIRDNTEQRTVDDNIAIENHLVGGFAVIGVKLEFEMTVGTSSDERLCMACDSKAEQ